ncbi:CoA ester lyase [Porphyrobacter sp. GA68]|uniref:HpcH/HpaI aldolase/citrate lyase family protein n=1 Tax=Porphyrobacter sp. GA68 TaxID=2883480 RepID=UPI001D17ECA4|nr:CoA ester lyase [Porphyrobacter sp. GA68]
MHVSASPAYPMRSLLFIPGDSEKKLAKVDGCGADVVIIDLEDAVAPARKVAARRLAADFLRDRRDRRGGPRLWVRVNALDTGMTQDDLAAVMPLQPDGIMQPKAEGAHDVERLTRLLEEAEEPGTSPTPILPLVTETARAPFRIGELAEVPLPRLAGLTWGAEDLAAALGATGNRDADGEWLFTFKLVRSLTLMAAHAAAVPAIETLHADFRDEEGLRRSSRQARAEGFSGRLAIHPAQVPVINEAFTPGEDELEQARRILSAFAEQPEAGTIGFEGRMLDQPHRKAAERTVRLAQALQQDRSDDGRSAHP